MNKILAVSALIAAVTAALHVFAGGAEIAAPLLASTLDAEPKNVLYAVWHMASIVLVLSAIALIVGACLSTHKPLVTSYYSFQCYG